MLRVTCTKQDCTVATTGKCLELHASPTECPNATSSATTSADSNKVVPLGQAAARRFPPGTELGLKDALAVTQGRYAHLIGILGATDAGKTCMLSALYLLASHAGLLPRFRFAGSLTLAGFELRVRRLRSWHKGKLPDQLAEHTGHADPRNPGLVHLALSDEQNGQKRVELLLTDLPGEWTSGLIKHAQMAERFEFLQRADGVVIAADGPKLADPGQKHVELINLRHLVDRLSGAVNLDRKTPLILAVCKADMLGLNMPDGIDTVVEHARARGFVARPIIVASISRNPTDVPNGYGIREVIEAVIDHRPEPARQTATVPEPHRSFGRSLGFE